eukprot:6475560-Amphidinium_carterae.1
MADRIGCQVKLDFDWGHPFLSADETASPWVNEWLRRGVSTWEIVGGADKGGIIVRRGSMRKCIVDRCWGAVEGGRGYASILHCW